MDSATRSPRVNLEVATRDFKFYIFDWDDNILHMPTRVYLEHLNEETGIWENVAVSTSVYAVVRADRRHYRFPSVGGKDAAFRDFADAPGLAAGDQQFLRDTLSALERIRQGEKPGPSYETLRKTLLEGRIFAIVTARGHASSTIREALKIFIQKVLTASERAEMLANLRGYRVTYDGVTETETDAAVLDHYLSLCRYHAVMSPAFCKQMARDEKLEATLDGATFPQRQELAKEFAIRDFTEHLQEILTHIGANAGSRRISIGFSDDDARNVAAVSSYIRRVLARRFKGFKFVVYDTSDPELAYGRKEVVTAEGTCDAVEVNA